MTDPTSTEVELDATEIVKPQGRAIAGVPFGTSKKASQKAKQKEAVAKAVAAKKKVKSAKKDKPVKPAKVAKPKKPAHDPSKMTQKCTVCGAECKFLEYRTKPITKKDGTPAIAKWPAFEPCPNIANPALHPHRHKSIAAMEIFTDTIQVKLTRTTGIEGVLFQLAKGKSIGSAWDSIQAACQRRMQTAPKLLYVAEDELKLRENEDDRPDSCHLRALDSLTPSYGYVLAVK